MTRGARVITDSAGRAVALPSRIARVYPTGNPAWAAVWCLARDRLAGWHAPMPQTEQNYLPREIEDLPRLERLSGQEAAIAAAAVREVRPDLVIDFGTCTAPFIEAAEQVQANTGVPVVMVDGRLANTARACALLGEVLGVTERARGLAQFFTCQWSTIEARLPGGAGPRVLYAIGAEGDKTVLRDSIHVDSLAMLGARNVAETPAGPGGRAPMRMDDIHRWDPEIVLTIDSRFHGRAANLPGWADLGAVRAGRVYLAPSAFLSWFDYPPSLNRVIGLPWLAQLFHPDIFTDDLTIPVRAFYDLYYGISLDESEARHLVNSALP